MSLGVGDRAPDFTLPATGGTDVSLHDYAGHPVVLVFYPGDDTPVCTKQLNSYNDELEQFTRLDAQVLGISAQDVSSHDAFAGKHGFSFPLLADVDKTVAGLYGTLGPIGFPAPQRVHHRWRRRGPLRPPGHRRPHVPTGEGTRGRTGQDLLTAVGQEPQHRLAVHRLTHCGDRAARLGLGRIARQAPTPGASVTPLL